MFINWDLIEGAPTHRVTSTLEILEVNVLERVIYQLRR